MNSWPAFKRFLELYYADPDFRSSFDVNPDEALCSHGLGLERSLLEAVTQSNQINDFSRETNNIYITEYRNRIKAVREVYAMRENPNHILDQRFLAWYRRQRNRLSFTCRNRRKRIDTSPVAFELSAGCSVQCPFCCFAPKKLAGVFEYNSINRKLWRSILTATRDIVGDLMQIGICYHSTEPLDNPNYESFLSDYYDMAGVWPQTTTALADRRVPRIRRLMRLIGDSALKQAALRISITTLSQLRRIIQEFSPEELQYIELNLNNPESVFPYSAAGRATKLKKSSPAVMLDTSSTSSCIAGFLINTVEKRVALVSPEVPSEDFPLGLNRIDEASFNDGSDFPAVLEYLIDKWMQNTLDDDSPLCFHPRVSCLVEGSYLRIRGDGASRLMSGDTNLFRFMDYIQHGQVSFREAAEALGLQEGAQLFLKSRLQPLYNLGIFQENIIR